jgi:ethanolamine transporter EutH
LASRLKAVLGGLACGIVSLFLTVPASVIIGERRPAPTALETSSEGLSFHTSFIDVNLLPSFLVALLIVVVAFTWMLRRREAHH